MISSGDGDFILYNNKKDDANYKKLHLFSAALLYIDNPITYYDSIKSMIDTTTEAYEKQILKYDPAINWLDINGNDFRKIGLKYNKSSEFWKS